MRYDHSRVCGSVAATLPGQAGHKDPATDTFAEVNGLSRRQRSLPAVLLRFCCRAAVDWPRAPVYPATVTLST